MKDKLRKVLIKLWGKGYKTDSQIDDVLIAMYDADQALSQIKSLLLEMVPEKSRVIKDASDYAQGEKLGTAFVEDKIAIGRNQAIEEMEKRIEEL